jgi:hypothetical protein
MSGQHGLPSAPRRLQRHRTLAVTAAFAAAVAIASSSVTTAAQVRLAAEVDAHWRGQYDILVRPPDSRLDLASTNGLVEPNFLGFTGHGGITLREVDAIRAIPDVEVAAPIAYIGLLTADAPAPTVVTSALPSTPTLYRATVTVTTSDGLSPRIVAKTSFRALLAATGGEAGPLVAVDTPNEDYGILGDAGGNQLVEMSTGSFLPPLSSSVIAVDPASERKLLGEAGAFLQPLIDLSRDGPYTAGTLDPAAVLSGSDAAVTIGAMARGSEVARSRPVYPVLVSSDLYSSLSATLSVVQLGSPIDGMPHTLDQAPSVDEAAKLAGPGTKTIGTTTVDLGPRLRPLRANDLSIAWPGTRWEPGGTVYQTATTFDPLIAARPQYEKVAPALRPGTPAFRIDPVGVVGAGGGLSDGDSSTTGEREQAYRSWTRIDAPVTDGFVPTLEGDRPFILAPVGEYDLRALQFPRDRLSYAPLGAYDPPNTSLIADPSGTPVPVQVMTPTVNPAGLIEVPPLAISDLSAAKGLRGATPIDAVRVRVAGLTGYTHDEIAKVERVASAIAALGLDVDIVAGSSPQPVDVYVPAYLTSQSPPGDLGWVEQHWTTLSAATRVVEAVSATSQWLLVLTLFTVTVMILGVHAVEGTARAREAGVLAAFGWRRPRILRWFVAEALVASGLVLVAGGAAWIAIGGGVPGALATLLTAAVFPVGALLSGLVATRRDGDSANAPSPWQRWPVRSVRGYAARAVLSRGWRSMAIIASLAIAAAAISPLTTLLIVLGAKTGPTLLASAVTAQLRSFQLAMLLLAATGGIGFVIIGLRRDISERVMELDVLSVSGWSPTTVRRMLRWQRVFLAAPAGLIAFMLGLVDARPIAGDFVAPVPVALLAALVGWSAAAWGELVPPATSQSPT